MPCWTLDELQSVGNYLRENLNLSSCPPETEIESRFLKYGGIIRYVFANDQETLDTTDLKARVAIEAFLKEGNCYEERFDAIEIKPEALGHVSHLIYQYCVRLPPDDYAFKRFTYQWSSEKVRTKVLGIHVKANFSKLLGTLADMFKGYKQLSPILFEDVVFVGIVNHLLKWTVCSSADPTLKWKPFSSFDKIETSEVFHRNQKMKPGVLYRPINTNFPGVDFLFLDLFNDPVDYQ
jgi:hypothetical protein